MSQISILGMVYDGFYRIKMAMDQYLEIHYF